MMMKQVIEVPPTILEAYCRLKDHGFESYLVGGSVRDFLLKRAPKDHDLATSATVDEILSLFPNSVTVGKAFGVIKVPLKTLNAEASGEVEIASFRKDLGFEDHRHPLSIEAGSAKEDAERRDFTVNSLFYDISSETILDFCGGMSDLQAQVIRTVGDPALRFEEDALRLLRALRFAATLGFQIEAQTFKALQSKAELVRNVSGERIGQELNAMFCGPHPDRSLVLLSESGILKILLPEINALKGVEQSPEFHPEGDVWKHTLKVMHALNENNPPPRSMTLSWGTLLHDVGKTAAKERSHGENFYGHEDDGVLISESMAERFKWSKRSRVQIALLIKEHMKFKDAQSMRPARLERWIRQEHFAELLRLHQADSLGSCGDLTYFKAMDAKWREKKKIQPALLTGKDLIELGLLPGPLMKKILNEVQDLGFDAKILNSEEARDYVRKNYLRK